MARRPLTKTEKFLGIVPGDLLAFVGGGGKSTLIHSLASRLAREERSVITTATRDFHVRPGDSPYVFLTDERPFGELLPNLREHGTVTLAAERRADGSLRGYDPEEVDTFTDLADYLFVEAEDSGGESLPEGGERRTPPLTTVLVAVAGLDALGPECDVNRFAARLTGPEGVLRCFPAARRTLLLLNKADRHSVRLDGARIAKRVREILSDSGTRVHVILTSVRDYLKPV